MSFIDVARDALKEVPIAAVAHERLSLAIERLAKAEAKIENLQTQIGSLRSLLESEQKQHLTTKQELLVLQQRWQEETKVHDGIEFRRGRRTGGKWMAFCPKCHLPALSRHSNLIVNCSDESCKWTVRLEQRYLPEVMAQLNQGDAGAATQPESPVA